MKKLTLIAIIALTGLALAAPAEARNFSGPKYMIQFMKDGMKFYSKTCTADGLMCGNWNVKG